MAQRRMFSPEIVCSEEFVDMPPSAQALYFHLSMRADDDGFVQPNLVMRNIGANKDDLKVLLGKRFVLGFESGVIVIKHWLIHNMIRTDRYKESRFMEEKKSLFIKDNKAYTDNSDNGTLLLATKWQPNGNQMAPQVRLGKVSNPVAKATEPVRVEREDLEQQPKPERHTKEKDAIYALFSSQKQPWFYHKTQKEAAIRLYQLLGVEKVKRGLEIMREFQDDKFCPQARTPFAYEQKIPNLKTYIAKKDL